LVFNPFYDRTGADKLRNPFLIGVILIAAIITGFAIAKGGMTIAFGLMALPFVIYGFIMVVRVPERGFTFAIIINFLLIGLMRYIPVKLGYIMDITLVATYLAIFFHYFNKKLDITPVKNDLVLLSVIWFIFIILELFNPEAISKMAWFSAMRGIGLYMLLIIPLVMFLYNEPKHLKRFLYIWAIFSIISSVKGFIQVNITPDPWEQKWLDEVGGITHILWGQLRAFGIYSDAGQFGAAQAHIGIVATILMLNEKDIRRKIFWFIVMAAGYYGMSSSGTRGAVFVPMAGAVSYLILRRNIRVILIGSVIMIVVYAFFRYTTIGNSNYGIYRMRTAFTPEDDASYQVRIRNQIIFEEYLKNKPFGGGIGHAGDRAQQYTPNTFLANLATDSWFVLIWAESGVIGLYLHMFILGYILGKSVHIIMFQIRNHELYVLISALFAGFVGILGASYGNAVLGQFPTGLVVYASLAYIFMAPSLEKKILDQNITRLW
jgi:hypothetical protein